MTFARKLELVCAVIFCILGLGSCIHLITYDKRISNSTDDIYISALMSVLYYLLPAVFIVLGSYYHAIKQKTMGRILLIIGCLLIIWTFFISLFAVAVKGFTTLFGKLNLALLALAIFIIILSFVVERQNKKATSSS